jgi:hypothetical protein
MTRPRRNSTFTWTYMAFKALNVREFDMNNVDFFIQTINQMPALRTPETIVDHEKGFKHADVLIPLLLEHEIR